VFGRESGSFTRAVLSFETMLSDAREVPAAVRRPLWAAELGIDLPCDVQGVRRAFRRLALSTHPDCLGGSHEAFLHAQRALEEALAAVQDAQPTSLDARFCRTQICSSRPSVYA
jgi:hypothetical protein